MTNSRKPDDTATESAESIKLNVPRISALPSAKESIKINKARIKNNYFSFPP